MFSKNWRWVPLLRPCQWEGGGGVPCRRLNFKTSRVSVYKCLLLIVGFAVTVAICPTEVVSCLDFILCAVTYFLGNVACRNLPWQGLPVDGKGYVVGFVSVYTTWFRVVIHRVGRRGHLLHLFVSAILYNISITTKRDTFFYWPIITKVGGCRKPGGGTPTWNRRGCSSSRLGV